ncbi:DUF4377 domain-containing protein [Tenacibaculum sp. UWU-22]|uniref:DUF4377 domain-containing protein n=1 Tax=Tenacibaculum sp. UWU-22 TaxID=3234187 RepID=UPI0034DAFD06
MKKLAYLVMVLVVSSCATNQKILWVNSSKAPCTGVGSTKCLLVQKGDYLDDSKWQLFNGNIEGFTYIPGIIYKLKVSVEDLDTKTLPADASSKKYKLIKVMSKKSDLKFRLNDNWILTHIKGEKIQLNNKNGQPRLEINIAENYVSGMASCNSFFGKVKKITDTQLVFSDQIGSTKMMCKDMHVEIAFYNAFRVVRTYKIENNNLYLFDENNTEVLRFKKVD